MAVETFRVMALSSGGLESFSATNGTPVVNDTNPPPNVKYSVDLQASDEIEIDFQAPENDTTNNGDQCVSCQIRFDDATPASSQFFFGKNLLADANASFSLRLNISGTLGIYDAVGIERDTSSSAVFTDGVWHELTILYFINDSTGYVDVYVGDVLVATASSIDTNATSAGVACWFKATTDVRFRVSEFMIAKSTTSKSDFNTAGYDVHEFAVSGTGFTTSGDVLNAGTWDNTGEQPLSETNTADYTDATKAGHAVCDGTILAGPNGAGISGTVAGAEWWFWADRGNGGGTTHTLRYGNGVDTINTQVFTPTGTFAAYSVISDAAGAVPLLTEEMAMGMEVSGAKDLHMAEMYAALAVEIPVAGGSLIYNPKRVINQILQG